MATLIFSGRDKNQSDYRLSAQQNMPLTTLPFQVDITWDIWTS